MTIVKPTDNIQAALDQGGETAFMRGEVYSISKPLLLRRSSHTVTAEPETDTTKSRPKVIAAGNHSVFESRGQSNITVRRLEITTRSTQSTAHGLNFEDFSNIRLEFLNVHHFRQAFVAQGLSKLMCSGLAVDQCWLHDNSRQGDNHGAAWYMNKVDSVRVSQSVVDTNGWRPGQIERDDKSHGGYNQGFMGPNVLIEDTVFYNNASHGVQMRSGGRLNNCVFVDNAIGLSYGLVNGGPCHPGGVRGSVENIVCIGNPGWMMHADNIDNAFFKRILFDDDMLKNNEALILEVCKKLDNPTGRVGIKMLRIENMYAPKWNSKGVYRNSVPGSKPTLVNVPGSITKPYIPLRSFVTPAWVTQCRNNPFGAAAALYNLCFNAWGV
jgi:hypothetical protein